MTLRVRAADLVELMDDPACDPDRLAATLRRFGIINRLVSGWGAVYRSWLRPHLASLGRPARVLDLGSGGGDVVSRLASYAEHDMLDVTWIGADPDPRALAIAAERWHPAVSFVHAQSSDLRDEGVRFDAVISNHVLHHLAPDELRAFAADSLALSTGPVLHADIARGTLPYLLYAIGITPFAAGTFLRTDGLRSIRRSFRADELDDALAETGAWRIERPAPFRLLAVGAPE